MGTGFREPGDDLLDLRLRRALAHDDEKLGRSGGGHLASV